MCAPLVILGSLVGTTYSAAIGSLATTTSDNSVEEARRHNHQLGPFRIYGDTRCDEHYQVAGWGVTSQKICEDLCLADDRCSTFSLGLSGDQGCFLYSAGASCATEKGWSSGHRDTRCGTAEEDAATVLSCPFGSVISNVAFASYGTPAGSCYNFTVGSCHGQSTKEIVEDLCLGENECTLSASSLVFGEPCPIVNKQLKVQIECTVGESFNEDIYFNAWSSRHWPAAALQTETRSDEWQNFLQAIPEYPVNKFSDRGVIVVAGGRYLEPALVMIKMLRQSGCTLRVQVWHVGKEEMRDVHRELLEPYDVETRDFEDFVGPEMLQAIQANVGMRLFQLKPLALLHTDLEDVMLLDSDNCPLRDPTYLFDESDFKEVGTVFWPDYWKTSVQNPIWDIIGQKPATTWEQESGQLLLHKATAWRAINLCVFLNNEFYMKLLNGDKDTFRFAWMAAEVPFKMVETWPTPVGTLKELHSGDRGFCSHTMLQHDLQGQPLFVHHNQLKHASLEVGQNFRYKKVPMNGAKQYRAVPVAGLKLASGQSLPCTDVQAEGNVLIDGDDCSVSEAGLEEFERRYFEAQSSIPTSAFTAQERAAPSLLASDEAGVKAAKMHRAMVEAQQPLIARLRRDTNSTCKPTEFELVKPTIRMDRICEYVTVCGDGQVQAAEPTAQSDRVCTESKAAGSKKFVVRVRDPKSPQHPYASYGSSQSFEVQSLSAADPQFVEALTVHTTRLETYTFVMAAVPAAHSFILTLDALGGPQANPYELGVSGSDASGMQTLSFTPGPTTPSTLYYQSHNQTHAGWKVIVSDPSFATAFTGRHAGKVDGFQRFSTAFSPAARLFTIGVPTGDGNFAELRDSCETQCGSSTACRGVFIFRTSETITCYGLNDISGGGVATYTDSESVAKKTH